MFSLSQGRRLAFQNNSVVWRLFSVVVSVLESCGKHTIWHYALCDDFGEARVCKDCTLTLCWFRCSCVRCHTTVGANCFRYPEELLFTVNYVLPDGKIITVGAKRFRRRFWCEDVHHCCHCCCEVAPRRQYRHCWHETSPLRVLVRRSSSLGDILTVVAKRFRWRKCCTSPGRRHPHCWRQTLPLRGSIVPGRFHWYQSWRIPRHGHSFDGTTGGNTSLRASCASGGSRTFSHCRPIIFGSFSSPSNGVPRQLGEKVRNCTPSVVMVLRCSLLDLNPSIPCRRSSSSVSKWRLASSCT